MEYRPADLKRFEALLTETATRLMSVSSGDATAETESVLRELARFFTARNVFLRRQDHHRRTSRLVAAWPAPIGDTDPKSDATAGDDSNTAYAESNTAYAESQSQDEVRVLRPGQSSEDDRRIEAIVGCGDISVATSPLVHDNVIVGVLGIADDGDRHWSEHDLRALSAVATLFAHLWGRLDTEEQLTRQVDFDELTGLPNRRKLAEAIEALGEDREASLLVIDIDNMKVINDGLDFEMGNRFIKGLAGRITSVVRPTGTVARLSGDQFAVLVVDTPPGHVERLAHRLVRELAETIQIEQGVGLARSVSVGVAHNYIAETNDQLLGEADAALHEAKRGGKKRAAVFDEEMRAKVVDSFEVEIELRQAIERDELTLHYQPEVDLDSGEIVAVEALLRWQHPTRGLLAAGTFIETAEESGLIVEIGDQVLRQAVRQLSEWRQEHPSLEMWINVSPAQLMSRDVATQMQMLLAEFDVDPQQICLEVTEHVVLGDLDATTGILRRLRDMGIKLALDDFGTGYSSMKQLKQLPITSLKIDMTFVAGLGISDHDSAIVDAAINLAAAFDLGTVAEGVETQQQITELRKRGCRSAQGYLLARPAAAAAISELLGRPLEIERLVEL